MQKPYLYICSLSSSAITIFQLRLCLTESYKIEGGFPQQESLGEINFGAHRTNIASKSYLFMARLVINEIQERMIFLAYML